MEVANWAWFLSSPGGAPATAVAAWVAVLVAVAAGAWVWSLAFDSSGVVADAAWVAVQLAVAAGAWVVVASVVATWVAVVVAVAAGTWVVFDSEVAAWVACGAYFEMRSLKWRSGLAHPAGMHHSQSPLFDLARPRRR